MRITIIEPIPGLTNEWEVWVQLDEGDPIEQNESMCIGTGLTKAEAVQAARAELAHVAAMLQAQL